MSENDHPPVYTIDTMRGRLDLVPKDIYDEAMAALRGLYEDNVDYLRLNYLGGFHNHWLTAARKALRISTII